ncbi:MAG: hypothetical protein HZY75_10750 [Nocardioidaceae bacterium]|nr:MAG: hypothetical protein HZY75_10750 [Nocardioidaceae bacterium]
MLRLIEDYDRLGLLQQLQRCVATEDIGAPVDQIGVLGEGVDVDQQYL